MARKKTKAYPESFRKEAVRLADLPDRTAADVARELGIHLAKGQFTVSDGVNHSIQESDEIRRLK